MAPFDTIRLAEAIREQAPDGIRVRKLVASGRGSLSHFTLRAGETSRAVLHRTVEEVWYFLSGEGEMWRASADQVVANREGAVAEDPGHRETGRCEEIVTVAAGVSVSIPPGTCFQVRAGVGRELTAVAVTMPPWPGEEEAVPVAGPWQPGRGPVAD